MAELRLSKEEDALGAHYECVKGLLREGSPIHSVVENVFNNFKSNPQYSQDNRFIEILNLHLKMQSDAVSIYEELYSNGVGSECEGFYRGWAGILIRQGNLREAVNVYQRGIDKALRQLLPDLNECLMEVGRRSMKHDSQHQEIVERPTNSDTHSYQYGVERSEHRVGDVDHFYCPLAVFEEPNPLRIPQYAKTKVYTEYQFEELRARVYLSRYPQTKPALESLERLGESKVNSLCEDEEDMGMEIPKRQVMDSIEAESKEIESEKEALPRQLFSPPRHQKNRYDASLVGQSFTVNTIEALNMVQEMWRSPAPQERKKEEEVFKVPEAPPPPHRAEHKNKVIPFNIFNDSIAGPSQNENNPQPNFGIFCETDYEKKVEEEKREEAPALQGGGGYAGDLSDVTCNTKAFAFVLPSSTPYAEKNKNRTNIDPNGSYVGVDEKKEAGERVEGGGKHELSVILESSSEAKLSSHKNRTDLEEGVKGMRLEGCEVNPLSVETQRRLLSVVWPLLPNEAFSQPNSPLPNITRSVRLGSKVYTVHGEIGKGAYARVVKATEESSKRICALKVEKPPCVWEYYICSIIKLKLPPIKADLFMDVRAAYIYSNGSVLETEWAKFGNLLDLVNQVKRATGKVLELSVATYLGIELVGIVETLHSINIIHADIKPDNFVLRRLPSLGKEGEGCVQLIDFGRSIDMCLFDKNTTFKTVVTTDGFQCNEMKENLPWTFQTDLYGLAGTVYCLLLGDYMKVVKKENKWLLQKSLARNMNRELWEPFFDALLNVESCSKLPKLGPLKDSLISALNSMNSYCVQKSFNSLTNILLGK